jgi:hypothetical protein
MNWRFGALKVTAYGIRHGSVVALVGGDSVPPRPPYTHTPAPAPTTTAHAPAPAPSPGPNQSPLNASMPPPPVPTQPVTPSESSAPINSQEAATITKIQSEWNSCEFLKCSPIRVIKNKLFYYDLVRSKLLPEVQSFLQILAAPRQERPSPEELKQNHKKFGVLLCYFIIHHRLILSSLLNFTSYFKPSCYSKPS